MEKQQGRSIVLQTLVGKVQRRPKAKETWWKRSHTCSSSSISQTALAWCSISTKNGFKVDLQPQACHLPPKAPLWTHMPWDQIHTGFHVQNLVPRCPNIDVPNPSLIDPRNPPPSHSHPTPLPGEGIMDGSGTAGRPLLSHTAGAHRTKKLVLLIILWISMYLTWIFLVPIPWP